MHSNAGRGLRRALLASLVLTGTLAGTQAQAQRYQWYTKGQCSGAGGTWQPNAMAVADGATVQPCDLGAGYRTDGGNRSRPQAGTGGGTVNSVGRARSDISGVGGRVAAGAALLGMGISMLQGMTRALEPAPPNPYAEQAQADIRAAANDRARQESSAAGLNERGRQLAAGGNDKAALDYFTKAWNQASGVSAKDAIVYYRNKQIMHAKITYAQALGFAKAGNMKRASAYLAVAASYAGSGENQELAAKIEAQRAELQQTAQAMPASQTKGMVDSRSSCTQINGEMMCR